MFTKTILATATAALISAGAMAASTSAADAHYSLNVSGGYYVTKYVSVPKNICSTYYKNVIVGYNYGAPIYQQVAYQSCKVVYVTVQKQVYVPYVSYSSNYSLSLHFGY